LSLLLFVTSMWCMRSVHCVVLCDRDFEVILLTDMYLSCVLLLIVAAARCQVFCAHPGLTRTDHFGKADVDEKWSSRGVEAFANSFWGTDGHTGALPLMFACTEPRLNGECAHSVAHMSPACSGGATSPLLWCLGLLSTCRMKFA
jgi:hypothetical protein